jgi:hypothetical protein
VTTVAVRPTIEVVGVPQDAAAAIRNVYDATGGHGLPEAVLNAARDKSSPLHRYFDWSDKSAAAAYRMVQAEQLVRRVRVKVITSEDTPPVQVRAYVSRRELPAEEVGDTVPGSYLAIEDVAGESDSQAALMQSIERDVLRLRNKYSNVREFALIVRELLDDD